MKTLYVALPDLALQVELRRAPGLRGRPVVVGGLPHERRRVLAVSPQAAAAGVRAGMTPRQAQLVCPEAAFLAADEAGYREALRQAEGALGRLSPAVEADGLEGAWLDARGLEGLFGNDTALARLALRGVREEAHLEARAGLAPWRLAAKLAARAAEAEPLVLGLERVEEFLRSLPVDWLPLSAESLERLELLGVRRVGRFLRLPAADLGRQVGSDAPAVRAALLGRAAETVQARRQPRRLIARRALDDTEQGPIAPGTALPLLVNRLAERLQALGLVCGTLDLEVDLGDGSVVRRETSLKDGTSDPHTLTPAFLRLLAEVARAQPVHEEAPTPAALALGVGQLTAPWVRQTDLFEAQRQRREQALAAARRARDSEGEREGGGREVAAGAATQGAVAPRWGGRTRRRMGQVTRAR